MLIFVVAIKIISFQLYYIALHIDYNTLHEKLTSMRIKQAPRSQFGNARLLFISGEISCYMRGS